MYMCTHYSIHALCYCYSSINILQYTDISLNCEFVVNFSSGLSEAILESKYLEKLGYAIPSLARSVALQEEKFIAYKDSLTRCLQRYHSAIDQLTEAEVSNIHACYTCM